MPVAVCIIVGFLATLRAGDIVVYHFPWWYLYRAVWLLCILAGQTNGDVILRRNGVNSRSYSSGRVLIYSSLRERFGSVKNDDYFDLKAATVICQQLQFDGAYGYSDASHDS